MKHKIFMFLLSMILYCNCLLAQNKHTLSGKVVDEKNLPLPGAVVQLHAGSRSGISAPDGSFYFKDLNPGWTTIEILFVGYKPLVDSVYISGSQHYEAILVPSPVKLQEVVITDHNHQQRLREMTQNTEIANQAYLRQNMGGSLMQSLERMPGLSTIDIGSGNSKPVIRGLSFQQVLVAENGIKHEGQQWAEDHGLEIDQYAVDNVEIIKGPSSLVYGGDAIGGVIDIKSPNIPAAHTVASQIDFTGKTNNMLWGSSAMVEARGKHLMVALRGTYMDFGDTRVPADSVDIYSYTAALHQNQLRNTAGWEQNMHLTIGYIGKQFNSRLFFSQINGKSGFFANAHGKEPRNVDIAMHDASSRDVLYPFHQVSHSKLISKSSWNIRLLKMELDLAYQYNQRQERSDYVPHGYMPSQFPDTLSFSSDLERYFEKEILSANLKTTTNLSDRIKLEAGLNSEFQDNQIDGWAFIIPEFRQLAAGGYSLVRYELNPRSNILGGIRYDYSRLESNSYSDWFTSPVVIENDTQWVYLERAKVLQQTYQSFSWSIGYSYYTEAISIKLNAGKGFRMPHAKELAANGVNYHNFRFEKGNSDLGPESSYQLDAGLEYNHHHFAMGITPFVNLFSNYIYLNPTPDFDRLYGNGNQEYEYSQSKVFRTGGEFHVHYHLKRVWHLGLLAEYVYSVQQSGSKAGFSLPFSPPATAVLSAKYQPNQWKAFIQPYLYLDLKLVAAQNQIVPPEDKTPGYQILNFGAGSTIQLGKQEVNLTFQIQNLLNRSYLNHTSYYRQINLPEAGRNFILNLTIPFQFNLKKDQ